MGVCECVRVKREKRKICRSLNSQAYHCYKLYVKKENEVKKKKQPIESFNFD